MRKRTITIILIWLLIPAIVVSADLFFGLTSFGSNYLKSEPQLPAGTPADIKVLQDGAQISAGDTSFIIGCSTKIDRIYFDKINSIKGMWSGSGASFAITYPYPVVLRASSPTDSWGYGSDSRISNVRESEEKQEAHPYLSVTEPLQTKGETYHQWINASAKMVVTYPQVGASNTYTDQQTSRQHDLKLFVVSDEEFNAIAQHQTWAGTQGTSPVFLYLSYVILWGFILIPVILIGGAIAKRVKKRKRGW